MKLKLAQMWDHNGTNMEAIGFMYRTYKVLIELDDNQEMSGATSPLSIPVLLCAPTLLFHRVPVTFQCGTDRHPSSPFHPTKSCHFIAKSSQRSYVKLYASPDAPVCCCQCQTTADLLVCAACSISAGQEATREEDSAAPRLAL